MEPTIIQTVNPILEFYSKLLCFLKESSPDYSLTGRLIELTESPYISCEVDKETLDKWFDSTDECLDNVEIAQMIAELMGKELKYKVVNFHINNPAHDIHYGLSDNNLRASGWNQPLSFKESIKNTIEWQKNNPEWIK